VSASGVLNQSPVALNFDSGSGVLHVGNLELDGGTLANTLTALSGGTITFTGTGVVNANQLNGSAVAGTQYIIPAFGTSNTLGVSTTKLNGGIFYPTADSTTAIQFNKADGTTNVLTVDTTNGRLGIGTNAPKLPFQIGDSAGLYQAASNYMNLSNNGYFSGGWKRIRAAAGGLIEMDSLGNTAYAVFPSGAADSSITFKTTLYQTVGGAVGIGPSNTSPAGTLAVKDNTATTGQTVVTFSRGAGDTADSTIFTIDALMKFGGTNSSAGAGVTALGTNCPAVTATAIYTWIKAVAADASVVWIPAWK
jgi:hypothetical protein